MSLKNSLNKNEITIQIVVVFIGWVFLLTYLFTTPFIFKFKWLVFYIGTVVIVNIVWQILLSLYLKLFKKGDDEEDKFYSSIFFNKAKVRPSKIHLPWIAYTPGEDGFFLVPLLYIGANYFTAAISGFLFAALHYPRYPVLACVPKGIFLFCVAAFILPKSGIPSLLIGHILVDWTTPFFMEMLNKFSKGGTPYTFRYDDGTLKEAGYCINKLREGVVIFYYPSGKLETECSYSNDKLDGVFKRFFENGNMEKEGLYRNGQAAGIWHYYYENGLLKSEANYENGTKEGIVKFYYPSGKLKSIYSCKNDKFDGEYKIFFESGNIKEVCAYKEGVLHGLLRSFDESGNFKEETRYESGNIVK
ncbi:MAG: toxin-antitoxin system YwqK family antitoxin [Candidatus Omnitrophota bacterium]